MERIHLIHRTVFAVVFVLVVALQAEAQFNSGSTGADGVLDTATMSCPNSACELQLPESGIFNFTTVDVRPGHSLRFKRNSRNTAVLLLAQGPIVIQGNIDISGAGANVGPYCGPAPNLRYAGPGGFAGGQPDLPGFGPGRGTSLGESGRWIGPLSLSPITGGSGGAGKLADYGGWGGGGGGAMVIASSASITQSPGSTLSANGGSDYSCPGGGFGFVAGSGSGGAFRLVASQLSVGGNLRACDRSSGNCGVIRLEAALGQLNFTGSSIPAATLVQFPVNSPPVIQTGSLPQLSIQTVGNRVVPSYAGTRFDTIDVLLENQLQDPIPVGIAANNIPIGTQVTVGFMSGSPSGTTTPCSLAGTVANTSCTATISNLNRTGVTYLVATAAFDPPPSISQYNPKGPNHVAKVKMESVLGGQTKFVFLNAQGRAVEPEKIAKEFLNYFGI